VNVERSADAKQLSIESLGILCEVTSGYFYGIFLRSGRSRNE
jgi:hypothetical protein